MKRLLIPVLLCIAGALTLNATRFAILSDVHVTPGNVCDSMLRVAVAEINSLPGIDFVVMNGDLTNEGSDQQLANVKQILDRIEKPLLAIPGNHENNWSQSATRTFPALWGSDRFVAATDSIAIIGLNCGPFMKMGDGLVKQEDLHWLTSTLDSLCASTGRKVVSFCHYPLADDLGGYTDYASRLMAYPTVIHVNGHYHVNKPYSCGDIDCMMVRSLDRKNGDFGYTLMDVTPDSVVFYQKRIGLEPEHIHAVAINANHDRATLPQLKPAGVCSGDIKARLVWADSASVFTRPALNNGKVFIGTSSGRVKAIDTYTGQLLWEHNTGGPVFSRLVPMGEYVMAPCSNGTILRLDTATGQADACLLGPGPFVADGIAADQTLYQGGYKAMTALNPATMETLWVNSSMNNYLQAAPKLAGHKLIFGAWDSYLYCLDSLTGQLLWKWNNSREVNMLGPGNVVPAICGNKVIIVAPDRYMTAIDLKTGKTLWRDNSHKFRESLGQSADGKRVYAKTMDGTLVAVDATAKKYKELWVCDMEMGYEHAPCVVAEINGNIYAGSRRGQIAKVSPQGQLLGKANLGYSEVNSIDADPQTGHIFATLVEGTVWQID